MSVYSSVRCAKDGDSDQEDSGAQLNIFYASYGPPEAEKNRPWELRIVTNKLRELARSSNKNEFILDKRWNGLFGDPCPQEKKILTVHYSINGIKNIGVWEEDSIVFLQSVSLRRDSMDQRYATESGGFREINSDLLKAILVYLPVFPDQLACAQVSKNWHTIYSSNYALASTFKIGARGIPGPCYVDMPLSFVKMVLSKSCASLVNLNLDNYEKLEDDVLSKVLKDVKNLRILCLNNCSRITDKSLILISEYNTNLQQLELKGVVEATDESCATIATKCTNLERFNLSNCSKITDITVLAICHNLCKLVILHMKHCHKATDAGLKYLGMKQSGTLELLSLWSMHRLTDKCLQGFENRTFAKLSSINFSGCYGFSEKGIRIISDNCKELLAVNLSYCHRLLDPAIVYLAENLPKLEHLDLNYIYRLTDVAMEAIRNNLKCLRSLNLSRCVSVNPEVVASLARDLTLLTELFLKGCPKFSNSTITQISKAVAERSGRLDLLDMRDNPDVTVGEALDILFNNFGHRFTSYEKLFLMTSSTSHRLSVIC